MTIARSDIFLIKGKNRYKFENALCEQVRIRLGKIDGDFFVERENGRIYIDTTSHALYIWDNETCKYVMVGCDYNKAILNGGNAYGN